VPAVDVCHWLDGTAVQFARTQAAMAPNIEATIRLSVIARRTPSGVKMSKSAKSAMPTSTITMSAGQAGAAGEGRPFARRRDRELSGVTRGRSFISSSRLSDSA